MAQNGGTDLLRTKPGDSKSAKRILCKPRFPIKEDACIIIRVIVDHVDNIVNIYVYKVSNIYGSSIDKGNAQL